MQKLMWSHGAGEAIPRRKDEVVHHSDGFRGGHPAVNIKVPNLFDDVLAIAPEVARSEFSDDEADVSRFVAWLRSLQDSDDYETLDAAQYWAFHGDWEMVETDAQEIFDGYPVECYTEGRSGGWLVVQGLPDIEDWDAILLAKWRKFHRYVIEIKAGFPWSVAWQLYANAYESWREDDDARRAVEYAGTDRAVLVGVEGGGQ